MDLSGVNEDWKEFLIGNLATLNARSSVFRISSLPLIMPARKHYTQVSKKRISAHSGSHRMAHFRHSVKAVEHDCLASGNDQTVRPIARSLRGKAERQRPA